jgi:hypothetical protein
MSPCCQIDERRVYRGLMDQKASNDNFYGLHEDDPSPAPMVVAILTVDSDGSRRLSGSEARPRADRDVVAAARPPATPRARSPICCWLSLFCQQDKARVCSESLSRPVVARRRFVDRVVPRCADRVVPGFPRVRGRETNADALVWVCPKREIVGP